MDQVLLSALLLLHAAWELSIVLIVLWTTRSVLFHFYSRPIPAANSLLLLTLVSSIITLIITSAIFLITQTVTAPITTITVTTTIVEILGLLFYM